MIEKLNRYEELLYEVLNSVYEKLSEGEVKIVDSKPIYISDGNYLTLFSIDTAKKHDLTVLKEKMEEFARRVRGKTVIADKGYVSKEFAEEMEKRGVEFVTVKRKNMIKSEEEVKYYRHLSKLRSRIETLFSIVENFGLRFIRTVSRRGLVVKIILSLLAFNIYRYIW